MVVRIGVSGQSSRIYKRSDNIRVSFGGNNRIVARTENVVSDSTYIAAIARILAFFAANPDWGWDPDSIIASLDLQIEAVEVPGRIIPVDWGWLT